MLFQRVPTCTKQWWSFLLNNVLRKITPMLRRVFKAADSISIVYVKTKKGGWHRSRKRNVYYFFHRQRPRSGWRFKRRFFIKKERKKAAAAAGATCVGCWTKLTLSVLMLLMTTRERKEPFQWKKLDYLLHDEIYQWVHIFVGLQRLFEFLQP